MAEAFDPYLTWLGIRDPQRPPNYYRLLGVDLFEDDPNVLTHAADRQMAHVRTFQTGKYSALSQRLLNELAAAKLCLLNPQKKAEYDAQLRRQLPKAGRAGAQPPPVPPATGCPSPAVAPLRSLDTEPAGYLADESSPVLTCAVVTLIATILTFGGLILLATIQDRPGRRPPAAGPAPQVTEPAPQTNTPLQPEVTEPDSSQQEPPEPETPEPETPEPETPESDVAGQETPEPESVEPEVAQPPAQQRLPAPSPVAQAETLQKVHDLFGEDYKTATEPEKKRALAAMLVAKASETTDDPVARYVLLSEARDLAIAAGDREMFLKTVKSIGEQYTVDWLVMATAVLQQSARLARPPEANEAIGSMALELAAQAVARDEYDMAVILAEAARDMGRANRTAANPYPQLVRRAVATMRNVASWRQQHEAFLKAQTVLVRRPNDPAASLTVGKYYCFVKQDLDRGLPMILHGGDPTLIALAHAESAPPSQTPQMVALAERWWAAAKEAEEPDRRNFQGRAVYWYEKALPDLTGLTRDVARHRVDEFRGTSAERTN